jgi:hypothetical protein
MFDHVFKLIFSKETTKYSKKQHKKLPEIMGPFFTMGPSCVGRAMSVVVDFHKNCVAYLKINNPDFQMIVISFRLEKLHLSIRGAYKDISVIL